MGIDDLMLSLAVFAVIAAVLYGIALIAIRRSDARYDAGSGKTRRKDFG